jgi:hypothetical protein
MNGFIEMKGQKRIITQSKIDHRRAIRVVAGFRVVGFFGFKFGFRVVGGLVFIIRTLLALSTLFIIRTQLVEVLLAFSTLSTFWLRLSTSWLRL